VLDRNKLLKSIQQVADDIFLDLSQECKRAQEVWEQIVADPTFLLKVKKVEAPWPVPFWSEPLDKTYPIAHPLNAYHVISVDGSQIYPDRHQGVSCYLLNVGSVALHYGIPQDFPSIQIGTGGTNGVGIKPVFLASEPYVFTSCPTGALREPQGARVPGHIADTNAEIVNCHRQELELQAGYALGLKVKQEIKDSAPLVLLYDGSLIFWHLDAQDVALRERFLSRYLSLLHQLHKERITTASYISLTKSRELLNLVRLQLCDFDPSKTQAFQVVEGVVDAVIVKSFLPEYHRTIVFQNNARISEFYPDQLRPHFFYLNVGDEIGRVEIPAWVAQDPELVNSVAQIVLDQCIKGRGYPVVIAEAHEQAVVKGPDREFFYHVLHKLGMEKKHQWKMSQKVIKKRGIGI